MVGRPCAPIPGRPPLPAYRALAVTVVTLALAYGVWYAYSVFLVALLREFGWSRSVLAGAFSVFTLVSGGAGPVLGALADRFGPRRLILIGGVLLAGSLWADSFVTRAWHLYLALRPHDRGRRGHRGMDARGGHGAAPVARAARAGARHRGLRRGPRHLPGRPALPGAHRRLRLALGLPRARHARVPLDPARHRPVRPRRAGAAAAARGLARRDRRGGELLAREGARERVVPLHRARGVPRQHLQPDAARAPGRVPRRPRASRHDRGLGDQRGGRGQHPGQDGRRLRLGSLPARGGLRARDGGDDRGRRRAVDGGGRARRRGSRWATACCSGSATRSPPSWCRP